MCAHERRQLPAFNFFAHLLLILIGFRLSFEGIKLSCNKNKLTRKINEPKSSELTIDITMVHLITRHFAPLQVLPSVV